MASFQPLFGVWRERLSHSIERKQNHAAYFVSCLINYAIPVRGRSRAGGMLRDVC
jgi:hypothetical protein